MTEQQSSLRDAVLDHAARKYGSRPEYLWARSPRSAVLRHSVGKKWYAAFLTADRAALSLPGPGTADILDIKCGPILAGSLRGTPGFLPAYHMNKEHWITILLDGTVPLEDILRLLDVSYSLTQPGKARRTTPRA